MTGRILMGIGIFFVGIIAADAGRRFMGNVRHHYGKGLKD